MARGDQQIHDAIGLPGDSSLFGWIVTSLLPQGWLTCDDGACKVADFVHLSQSGDLTLVPVKAAATGSPGRGISVDAYQEVVSQTTKNLLYVDTERLLERLRRPRVARPACWLDGRRTSGRQGMLDALDGRNKAVPAKVLVVQPHVTHSAYVKARAEDDSIAGWQLRLLETLLNGARATAIGLGSDLTVVGAASPVPGPHRAPAQSRRATPQTVVLPDTAAARARSRIRPA
jgi:hypothetical protein